MMFECLSENKYFFSFFNYECSIIVESIIKLTVYIRIDFWFVFFQIWIFVYVILQYVILE